MSKQQDYKEIPKPKVPQLFQVSKVKIVPYEAWYVLA